MKYLLILLLFFSCAEKKKADNPRPAIEARQAEIKTEIKQLTDSRPVEYNEHNRDSVINVEANINRKITALEKEYDSLATVMKKYNLSK